MRDLIGELGCHLGLYAIALTVILLIPLVGWWVAILPALLLWQGHHLVRWSARRQARRMRQQDRHE
jgi:hypothetical protein